MRKTALLFIALLSPAMALASEWNLDHLMQNLAAIRSDHAGFVEKKSIAMLEKPIESSGELYYTTPDHLEKRTLKPKPESLTVDGDTLVIERNHQTHHLQLQSYPEIAAFIDSIRGTLAGDRRALERNYHLALSGNAEHWTLQLLPLSDAMQKVAKQIRISGEQNTLLSIEIIQADGDSSVMSIARLATP